MLLEHPNGPAFLPLLNTCSVLRMAISLREFASRQSLDGLQSNDFGNDPLQVRRLVDYTSPTSQKHIRHSSASGR